MGSMFSSPTVSLFFPLGMAIRHRASSLLLPSYSHLFASPFYLVLGCIAVAVLGRMLVLSYCRCAVVRRGFHIDAMTATQLLTNTTRFSLPRGHWNPETLEPPSAQGGERAPTQEPGKGTDPRNGFLLFRYPLGSHRRSDRCAFPLPSCSWRLRRPGWCTLVAGTVFGLSFPETLKGRRVPIVVGRELFKQCVLGELCRRHSQCARVAGDRRSEATHRQAWGSLIRTRARATRSDAQAFHPFPSGSQPPFGG